MSLGRYSLAHDLQCSQYCLSFAPRRGASSEAKFCAWFHKTGDHSSYPLLHCSTEDLRPLMGLEGFFHCAVQKWPFLPLLKTPRRTRCREAAGAAFLVALGQAGLVLAQSRSWHWVTAVVSVSQDMLLVGGTGGEAPTAGLWALVCLFSCLRLLLVLHFLEKIFWRFSFTRRQILFQDWCGLRIMTRSWICAGMMLLLVFTETLLGMWAHAPSQGHVFKLLNIWRKKLFRCMKLSICASWRSWYAV